MAILGSGKANIEEKIKSVIPLIKQYLGTAETETAHHRNWLYIRNQDRHISIRIRVTDIRSGREEKLNMGYIILYTSNISDIMIWEDGDISVLIN